MVCVFISRYYLIFLKFCFGLLCNLFGFWNLNFGEDFFGTVVDGAAVVVATEEVQLLHFI